MSNELNGRVTLQEVIDYCNNPVELWLSAEILLVEHREQLNPIITDLNDYGYLNQLVLTKYMDVVRPDLSLLTVRDIQTFLSLKYRDILMLGSTECNVGHLLSIESFDGINKSIPPIAGVKELYLTCSSFKQGLFSIAKIPNLNYVEVDSLDDRCLQRAVEIVNEHLPITYPSDLVKLTKQFAKHNLTRYI